MKMTTSLLRSRLICPALITIFLVLGCVKPKKPVPIAEEAPAPQPTESTPPPPLPPPPPPPPPPPTTVPATPPVAKFAKNQASIKGLLVEQLEGSRHAGKASQMTATGREAPEANELNLTFNQEVGVTMSSALGEVVKFHALRHPDLKAGLAVEFAFENQYNPKDGPSAALACALLVESLFTGIEFDPEFAITGDMNSDGAVKPVGGIDGKVRGATRRGCKVVAIPTENEPTVPDLIIQTGLPTIYQIQIFSTDRFEAALKLAASKELRSPDLAKAIAEFSQVQEVLNKPNGMNMLNNPHMITKLQGVLALAPNHLSAKYLLLKAQNREPKILSLIGSLQFIDIQAEPMIRAIRQGKFDPNSSSLDGDNFKDTQFNLSRVRSQLDPRTQKCADAIVDFAKKVSDFVNNPPKSRGKLQDGLNSISVASKRVAQEYDDLESRLDVREELMR
jgi:hypothetical protein